MVKACPSCGTAAAPEARFCRLCGAPVKLASHQDGPISPLAQTVPLTGEARSTDNFPPGEQKRAAETSRVKREEIEHLLRRPSIEHAPEDNNGPIIIPVAQDFAAPTTSELDPPARAFEPEATVQALAQAVPQADVQADVQAIAQTADEAQSRVAPSPRKPVAKARRGPRWIVPVLIALCGAVVGAGLLALFISRRQSAPSVNAGGENGSASPAQGQVSLDSQLSEAESLLASGDTSGALTRLRAAVSRDPSNARAHRLLGEALERSGSRREAIAEYEAATRRDASDTVAWRALASAQHAEGLYREAVESYRRLLALTGENGLDDNGQLEYAEALRLAGYTEDARAVYQKVAAGAPQDLARQATKRLSELSPARTPAATVAAAPSAAGAESATDADPTAHQMHPESARGRAPEALAQNAASPSPSPAPSPPVHAPQRPTSAPAPAQGDADTYYFQALGILNGREPKSLPRAELLRALQLFQNAATAKGGAHHEQARKYAEQLGREFDRRPRQK